MSEGTVHPELETGDQAPSGARLPPEKLEAFGNELIAALKSVYDPEIPVDIYELGLIYKLERRGQSRRCR